jgi:hypothetical protein
MTTRTVSCHQFRSALGHFRAAAITAPVVITTRGRPTHVLMTWLEYRLLFGEQQSLVDRLAMAEGAIVDLSPGRLSDITKPADLD